MQAFIVSAESKTNPQTTVVFLVKAESHRDAWATARKVARTGKGAFERDPRTDELKPLALARDEFTVRRVLSAEAGRRGRPPKITTEDLLRLASHRRVNIPPRVARVIRELEGVA